MEEDKTKQKLKLLITKILLFIMLGAIGYLLGKWIYMWYRKKYDIQTDPNLLSLIFLTLLISIVPNMLLVAWYLGG